MLTLENVSLRRGTLVLFEHASFQVHKRHRLGLVGANGSGKSSLFALLRGELETDDGVVRINAKDRISSVAQESPESAAAAIDYVLDGDTELRQLQTAIATAENTDDAAALPELYESLVLIDGFRASHRAATMLHGLGFASEEFTKPVREFSGGWRMRLNLAQALMCR